MLGQWQMSHLRKDLNEDHVKEAKSDIFKHMNRTRLSTWEIQVALKIWSVKA